MKITSFILTAVIASSLSACSDNPHGISTKIPVGFEMPGQGEEEPEIPDSEVVSPTPGFTLDSRQTTITPASVLAVMEGFGASDCWLPNTIGQYWAENRPQLAEWLFSKRISNGQPDGIGLSMWRFNLGGGSWEQGDASNITLGGRAECFLDGSAYNWKKCSGQMYFMKMAKAYGCESFVLFSNTPLVRWTLNGQGRSDNGENANLKDDCYGSFAEYMADVAARLTEEGYNITHISPVNEPAGNWSGNAQEGSSWKNPEIARLVTELDKALQTKGIKTRILIPEAGAWDLLYQGNPNVAGNQINAFFNETYRNSYVGNLKSIDNVVAGHSYWTFDNWNSMRDVRKKVAAAAQAKGLRVWQTEWSMLDREPSEIGKTYDEMTEFDIALYMSKIIHNDISVAGCTSWSYWTAMSVERWNQKNRFELIQTTPAGGNYSDDFTAEGTVRATDNLWVLGNYSLFVRPGYSRISLECDETKDFFGTAYASPDGKTIVAVYTNADRDKGVLLDCGFEDAGELAKVWRYTTTADKHLKGERFKVGDKVFLEPYSVTTVVYTFE